MDRIKMNSLKRVEDIAGDLSLGCKYLITPQDDRQKERTLKSLKSEVHKARALAQSTNLLHKSYFKIIFGKQMEAIYIEALDSITQIKRVIMLPISIFLLLEALAYAVNDDLYYTSYETDPDIWEVINPSYTWNNLSCNATPTASTNRRRGGRQRANTINRCITPSSTSSTDYFLFFKPTGINMPYYIPGTCDHAWCQEQLESYIVEKTIPLVIIYKLIMSSIAAFALGINIALSMGSYLLHKYLYGKKKEINNSEHIGNNKFIHIISSSLEYISPQYKNLREVIPVKEYFNVISALLESNHPRVYFIIDKSLSAVRISMDELQHGQREISKYDHWLRRQINILEQVLAIVKLSPKRRRSLSRRNIFMLSTLIATIKVISKLLLLSGNKIFNKIYVLSSILYLISTSLEISKTKKRDAPLSLFQEPLSELEIFFENLNDLSPEFRYTLLQTLLIDYHYFGAFNQRHTSIYKNSSSLKSALRKEFEEDFYKDLIRSLGE